MTHSFPMNVETIMSILPHRPPMLMLDQIINCVDGEIEAEKLVNAKGFYFEGHFPGKPILPGVMIVEAIAQAGALLASLDGKFDTDKYLLAFAGIEKAKFRRPVSPNETLRVFVKVVKQRRSLYKFEGRAMVGDDLVAQTSFSAALAPR